MMGGFAKPVFALILLGAFAAFLPSSMLAVAYLVGLIATVCLGDLYSGYQARRQVANWCAYHGFSVPRWKHRGGFVSWGCSFWSFCEILKCEFEDSSGATHDVMIDVFAPAFGF